MGWSPKPQLSETRGSGAAFPKIKDGVRAKSTLALDSQSKATLESRHVVPRSEMLPAPCLWVSGFEGPPLPTSHFVLHLFQLFSWILIGSTCKQWSHQDRWHWLASWSQNQNSSCFSDIRQSWPLTCRESRLHKSRVLPPIPALDSWISYPTDGALYAQRHR